VESNDREGKKRQNNQNNGQNADVFDFFDLFDSLNYALLPGKTPPPYTLYRVSL